MAQFLGILPLHHKMTETTFAYNLAELWDASVEVLFDKLAYVDALVDLFASYGITEKSLIMDVAGGTGFPVIDLIERGWHQVIYNDGSYDMFQYSFQKARERGISVLSAWYSACWGMQGTRKWGQLETIAEETYDALLCKGNSLPYVVSWGEEAPDLTKANEELRKSLQVFYDILVPGGILYVDKHVEGQDHVEEDIGLVDFQGRSVSLTFLLENRVETRTRHWTLQVRDVETGEEEEFYSQSYLITEEDLVSLLLEVGFKDVKKHVLPGDIYEGFVAVK